MTSIKSTSNPRPSLCPPLGDRNPPNAPMVDASNVEKSIRKHSRQRDQETATEEEQKKELNQQRLSLAHAFEQINTWKKIDSTNVQRNN
jgi:hypothetical protein